jgi:hypothetical protein
VKAVYARRAVCPCGFSLLADEIPLGTEYEVRPGHTATLSLYCGGCKKVTDTLPCIFVETRGASRGGYLPAAIFEIDEGGKPPAASPQGV